MCADIYTLDFFKLVLYLTFFCVLCMFYGMPIHIIRDVALTIRSFYKRIRDFVQYKHATKDMNARYPDATAEEISREDVCIICRENMTAWQDPTTDQGGDAIQQERQPIDDRQRAKKLPCGHLLHFACLRSWLERQQICPTCRTPVLSNPREPPNSNEAAAPAVQGQTRAINPPAGAPHVYTFGPFRLVFGARHVNHDPQTNPLAAGAVGNPTDTTPSRNPATLYPGGIQAQLFNIEQHISREISNLNLMSDQLQVIRALQSELTRLRMAQSFPGNTTPSYNFQYRQIGHSPSQQTVQAYRQVPVGQGTPEFPTGLTIPDNWTLHALQRISGSVNTGTQPGNSRGSTPQQAQPMDNSDPVHGAESTSIPGAGNNACSVEVQDPGASTSEQNPSSTRTESGKTSAEGRSINLPDWGSTAAHSMGNDEQHVEQNSRQKGKGKAVTIEDDADEVDD